MTNIPAGSVSTQDDREMTARQEVSGGAAACNNPRRIQCGIIERGCQTHIDWNLHEGSGDRNYEIEVSFSEEMDAVPVLMISLAGLECSRAGRCTVDLSRGKESRKGFSIFVSTRSKARVYRVKVSYTALVMQ